MTGIVPGRAAWGAADPTGGCSACSGPSQTHFGPATTAAGPAPRGLIIGIGNPDCGDDGIGPLVVQRLAGRVPPEISLLERSGDTLAMIDDWAGQQTVILVDAAAAGPTAGAIHRIDLARDALPADVSLSSTHAFGVAEAVNLARTLDLLPARLVVYAVAGVQFAPGVPMSAAVAASADAVADRIMAELDRLDGAAADGVAHA